jgi:hypothetical protein
MRSSTEKHTIISDWSNFATLEPFRKTRMVWATSTWPLWGRTEPMKGLKSLCCSQCSLYAIAVRIGASTASISARCWAMVATESEKAVPLGNLGTSPDLKETRLSLAVSRAWSAGSNVRDARGLIYTRTSGFLSKVAATCEWGLKLPGSGTRGIRSWCSRFSSESVTSRRTPSGLLVKSYSVLE